MRRKLALSRHLKLSPDEQITAKPELVHIFSEFDDEVSRAKMLQLAQKHNAMRKHNPNKAYKLLKPTRKNIRALRNPGTGALASDLPGKLEAAATFNESLYARHIIQPVGDIAQQNPKIKALNRPYTWSEFTPIVNKLVNNKACGLDGIHNEYIKYGGEIIPYCLATLANFFLRNNVVPDDMKKSKMCLLYKKGDDTDLGNYRNLSLQSAIGKVITTGMANRIVASKPTSDLQNGFKSQHSTTDTVMMVTEIVANRRHNNNKKNSLLLLGFEKSV